MSTTNIHNQSNQSQTYFLANSWPHRAFAVCASKYISNRSTPSRSYRRTWSFCLDASCNTWWCIRRRGYYYCWRQLVAQFELAWAVQSRLDSSRGGSQLWSSGQTCRRGRRLPSALTFSCNTRGKNCGHRGERAAFYLSDCKAWNKHRIQISTPSI